MQTAVAHNLTLKAGSAATVRKAGGRRLPALRSASTVRCQAANVLATAKADEAVTIRFDAAGKPVVSLGAAGGVTRPSRRHSTAMLWLLVVLHRCPFSCFCAQLPSLIRFPNYPTQRHDPPTLCGNAL
jgi:hypothetical protein